MDAIITLQSINTAKQMKNFLLFQINMAPEEIDVVNREGWDHARTMFPRVGAYLANYLSMMPSEDRRVYDISHYDLVATVRAASLDEVFEVTNVWERPEQVRKFREHVRSGSVGDIIADLSRDRFYMISSYGFDDITEKMYKA